MTQPVPGEKPGDARRPQTAGAGDPPPANDAAERATVPYDPRGCPSGGPSRSAGEALEPDGEDGREFPTIPGYAIEGVLGRGGMGIVYKARQLQASRLVALKMILAGAHAGSEERARFRAEAEAIARLQHPHIVQVFEVGEHGGLPFFSLEYCPGGSLRERLQGTPLPPRDAAVLAEQLARAVATAHGKGIIHRDLNPANVLLAEDGSPRITDFGLARKLNDAGWTQSGALLGTPSYMAPEQATGDAKRVGPAADVYALGAILYECLTGRPPFKGATALETIRQVEADEPVRPALLQPRMPRDLETVCLKCLQKEPLKRYATAAELADDLRRFQAGEPIRARPVGRLERAGKWVWRNPVVTALLAAVVLALLLGTGIALWFAAAEDGIARHALVLQGEADDARAQADEQRQKTEAALLRSNWLAYAGQVALARREWEDDDPGAARALLDACRWDLRDWEYRYVRRLVDGNQRRLFGHDDIVYGVAVSPDGKLLATGGGKEDPTVRLWDAGSGLEVRTLRGHTNMVRGVAFRPDGLRLVSGSWDGTVREWDVATGKEVRSYPGHTDFVGWVAFSRDGLRVVTTGGDRTVRIWDVATGAPIRTLTGLPSAGLQAVFSADGKRVIAGALDGTVQVWDATTGMALKTFAHEAPVYALAVSPDDRTLVTAGTNNVVKVWDLTTDQLRLTLPEHRDIVYCVAFSPDGKLLVSASADRTVKVWDARTWRLLWTLRGPTQSVIGVAFSGDGTRLVGTSADRSVTIWEPFAAPGPLTLHGHKHGVIGVAVRANGRWVASSSHDGTVRIWDPATGALLQTLGDKVQATCLAVSADGDRIVTGGSDQAVKIWEVATGRIVRTLTGHSSGVRAVAVSPDGKRVASGGLRVVLLWDAETGRQIRALEGHANDITALAFSPDGTRLASASLDGTVRVWDGATGDPLRTFHGHANHVLCLAFSRDGKRLASGDGQVNSPHIPGEGKVWDAATGEEFLTLRGHAGPVSGVCFGPGDRRVLTASWDRTVKVWELETGQETLTLKGHTLPLVGLAMSADGGCLACGSGDAAQAGIAGEVMVWDAAALDAPRSFKSQPVGVNTVAFSGDGRHLASGGVFSTIEVWDPRTGQEENRIPRADGGTLYGLALDQTGRFVVSAGYDHTVKVWDLAGPAEPLVLEGHAGPVLAVALSPDGQRIVSGSEDRTVKLWDARGGEVLFTLEGHTAKVTGVAFSRDGGRVVSGSADGTLRLWDAASGRLLRAIEAAAPVEAVAINANGDRVATGSGSFEAGVPGEVRVWNAASGEGVYTMAGHRGAITSLAFSPEGRWLASGSRDTTIRLWDMDSGRLRRTLSGHSGPVMSVAFDPAGKVLASGSGGGGGGGKRPGEVKLWEIGASAPVPGH